MGCDVRLSEVADTNDPQAHIWKGIRTESQSLPLGLSSSSQGPQQMPKAENTIALTLATHPQKDPSCHFLKDTTPCGKSQLIICEASSLKMVPVLGLKDAKNLIKTTGPENIQLPGTHLLGLPPVSLIRPSPSLCQAQFSNLHGKKCGHSEETVWLVGSQGLFEVPNEKVVTLAVSWAGPPRATWPSPLVSLRIFCNFRALHSDQKRCRSPTHICACTRMYTHVGN